jgi:segregation and condensation protein B
MEQARRCGRLTAPRRRALFSTAAFKKMESQSQPRTESAAPSEDHGLSLDALTAGFAELVSTGQNPYEPAAPPVPATSISQSSPTEDPGPEITPRSIVEAMLFVGHPENQPLSSPQMAALMRGVNAAEVDEHVRDLNEQYRRNGCPYTIISQGAGYALTLLPDFAVVRERLAGRVRQARLSQAAIEVLAIVAYNGSMTNEEISRTRGRPSGAMLTQLVRRQLLKIDRSAGKPRDARYGTTERFLQLFGLESLADLPRSQDVEER